MMFMIPICMLLVLSRNFCARLTYCSSYDTDNTSVEKNVFEVRCWAYPPTLRSELDRVLKLWIAGNAS
jgi:hypothetical protein